MTSPARVNSSELLSSAAPGFGFHYGLPLTAALPLLHGILGGNDDTDAKRRPLINATGRLAGRVLRMRRQLSVDLVEASSTWLG